ncbi:MAG: ATP-grasp domain-containing protein [Gaiellaceae bacterium]
MSVAERGAAISEKVTIVAGRHRETADALARAWLAQGIRARVLTAGEARREVRPGEVVLNRLDVLETLDGVEPGLEDVDALARMGARVLNKSAALHAAHDKLETVSCLEAAQLPQPRTVHVTRPDCEVRLPHPYVVKPRYGSWGRDVFRCASSQELRDCLEAVRDRSWFRRQGAIVQELLPLRGYDLRLVVAGGRVTGAAERVARAGEWRTNVSLGGTLRAAAPDAAAWALGIAAAAAIGLDLVGVDLTPTDSGWVVLELNGAVDFDDLYWLEGTNVYTETADALGLTERSTEPQPNRART